jgi:DnaJ domain
MTLRRAKGAELAPGDEEAEALRAKRGGVQLRILICWKCHAAWPTERDPEHGGSRQDGEPCAYRWADGRVCRGTVSVSGVDPNVRGARQGQRPWGRAAPPVQPLEYTGRRDWTTVLGLERSSVTLKIVRDRYRELAKRHHPDAGGDHATMVEINEAIREAYAELNQPS